VSSDLRRFGEFLEGVRRLEKVQGVAGRCQATWEGSGSCWKVSSDLGRFSELLEGDEYL
jgi:hypothetical protein